MEPTEERKKPKWLRELETQSWQAELLISVATIVTLFKLPDLLLHCLENLAVSSSEFDYLFLTFMVTYLLAGVYSLIASFSIHFFLRALWIAFLGLNSVYPNGIIVKSEFTMSKDYMKKMKMQY